MENSFTIIMATYNRNITLEKTLNKYMEINRKNYKIELIIVDNNSNDRTSETINKYKRHLPITYLHENKQGKNYAVNKALDRIKLNDVVVFTDDDIKPHKNWLIEIDKSINKFPDVKVFGGKILLSTRTNKLPELLKSPLIRGVYFGEHDMGENPLVYSVGKFPGGGNFWVKKSVFENNLRFNTNIGPSNNKMYKMGSESSLLARIQNSGEHILYYPMAIVYHSINANQINAIDVYKRCYRLGSGVPHVLGLCQKNMYNKFYSLWVIRRMLCLFLYSFKIGATFMMAPNRKNIDTRASSIISFAYNIEALNISFKYQKGKLHLK